GVVEGGPAAGRRPVGRLSHPEAGRLRASRGRPGGGEAGVVAGPVRVRRDHSVLVEPGGRVLPAREPAGDVDPRAAAAGAARGRDRADHRDAVLLHGDLPGRGAGGAGRAVPGGRAAVLRDRLRERPVRPAGAERGPGGPAGRGGAAPGGALRGAGVAPPAGAPAGRASVAVAAPGVGRGPDDLSGGPG